MGRSYQTPRQDLNRVMNRIKALYRGWGIPCAGKQVYAPRYRAESSTQDRARGHTPSARARLSQSDGLQALQRTLRPELSAESRKHKAAAAALNSFHRSDSSRELIALMQTPQRFRSKRQL